MKPLIRGALLAAVFALMPPASWAQPSCPLPQNVQIDWLGPYTGCKPGGVPCATTEPIAFAAKPVGGSFPTCATFLWDFGDNVQSSLQNPTHAFAVGTTFTVTLLVSNGLGGFIGDGRQVPVANTVLPKILTFKATPSAVLPGQAVVFSWTTQNASKGVRIDSTSGVLKVTLATGNQFSYVPPKSMSYTLTAIGDAAQFPSSPITVEVLARHRAARH